MQTWQFRKKSFILQCNYGYVYLHCTVLLRVRKMGNNFDLTMEEQRTRGLLQWSPSWKLLTDMS